jgi:acyl-CoA hydrolase
VVTGEVCGGEDLYRFVAEHPQIEFHPCTVTHDLLELTRLPRFVSINSAVEVDLHGQVNGETVDGVQISGVGGSLDFVDGTAYSPGGLSIVALPSTTEDGGRSKIVARLGEAAPATIPRFCGDYVVTEFGSARLRGKTLRERAAALIEIAHPDHRNELERSTNL